ncbi:hypothetical protein DFJ73DRAFT_924921 [Zopfochytrium polystomum]|nr:hypothetical protein DFJ73DRAFT_924921 [Zopfochytrium polystomum]
MFGGVLDLQRDKEGRTVSAVVEQCCGEAELRGITSQGIYRLSGNTATIKMKVSTIKRARLRPARAHCWRLWLVWVFSHDVNITEKWAADPIILASPATISNENGSQRNKKNGISSTQHNEKWYL